MNGDLWLAGTCDLKKLEDDYTPISAEAYPDSVKVLLGSSPQRVSVPCQSLIYLVSYGFWISNYFFSPCPVIPGHSTHVWDVQFKRQFLTSRKRDFFP